MNPELNERLLLVREKLELKQGQFADSLQVKQGTISDIERKRIGVSNKLVEKLALVHKVSTAWFYTGEGNMFIGNNLKNIKKLSEQMSGADIDSVDFRPIILNRLDDIIKEKLFDMDFYLRAICHHLGSRSKQENEKAKTLLVLENEINQLVKDKKGDHTLTKSPDYTTLNLIQKIELIMFLEDRAKSVLSAVWEVTRDIKTFELSSKGV